MMGIMPTKKKVTSTISSSQRRKRLPIVGHDPSTLTVRIFITILPMVCPLKSNSHRKVYNTSGNPTSRTSMSDQKSSSTPLGTQVKNTRATMT